MYFELYQLLILLGAIAVLAYVAWVDYRTMEIPDKCHLVLIGLACLQMLGGVELPLAMRGWGLVAMSLPMLFVNRIKEDSFGGGDIKMCGAVGFFLGAPLMMAGAMIGLLLAGVYGGIVMFLKIKKPKDSFALGPFLSFGFVAVMMAELMNHGI
jgi:leader peptidase (prepilin peptidase) / N-methyltransferase